MRSSSTYVARFEAHACRRGGTRFPVEVSLSRTDTPDGARYAAVVRDVTEQRMAHAMLNLYSRALDCTANGVVISDISLPGQPIFYANPAFCSMTGYPLDEVIGRNGTFLLGSDTQQPALAELRAAASAERGAQAVLRNYRKDGTLFFNELSIAPVADPEGGVRHYVGVHHDVTERERSRLAIAERSARLNAVFDLSPDGFVVFDAAQALVYCNPAFLDMTGWSGQTDLQALPATEFDRRFQGLCDQDHPVRRRSSRATLTTKGRIC